MEDCESAKSEDGAALNLSIMILSTRLNQIKIAPIIFFYLIHPTNLNELPLHKNLLYA